MTPRALERTELAVRLIGGFGGQCWVCANRGHHHLTGKCDETRCPCARRRQWPISAMWAEVAARRTP